MQEVAIACLAVAVRPELAEDAEQDRPGRPEIEVVGVLLAQFVGAKRASFLLASSLSTLSLSSYGGAVAAPLPIATYM